MRNRLISGLAQGTLVVSASKKSGTLITAARAMQQERDVFVFPGEDGDENYEGARGLLAQGAVPVLCAADILQAYAGREIKPLQTELPEKNKTAEEGPSIQKNTQKEEKIPSEDVNSLKTGQNHLDELSDDAVTLWKVLLSQDRHINELTQLSGLSARRVLAALTELELAGLCESHAGRMYCRREGY